MYTRNLRTSMATSAILAVATAAATKPASPAPVDVKLVRALFCPECSALWLHWPKEITKDTHDHLNLKSAKSCDFCERGGANDLVEYSAVAPASPAPAESMVMAHTCAGFHAAFRSEHKRDPVAQEIWNAAIRSWCDLSATPAQDANPTLP